MINSLLRRFAAFPLRLDRTTANVGAITIATRANDFPIVVEQQQEIAIVRLALDQSPPSTTTAALIGKRQQKSP